jgi:replicative DNA helicase
MTAAFPIAVEAEQALIGAMLISPSALALLDIVDDDHDLTQPALQKVIRAIRRLVADGAPVDHITVLCELRRTGESVTAAGQTSVGQLLTEYAESAPVPASASWYARGILEASLRRRVFECGTRLAQRASCSDLADLLLCLDADVAAIVEVKTRLDTLAAVS